MALKLDFSPTPMIIWIDEGKYYVKNVRCTKKFIYWNQLKIKSLKDNILKLKFHCTLAYLYTCIHHTGILEHHQAHLREAAEGAAVTHSYLWPRLINPSLIWSTLVNTAIAQQACLQRASMRCRHYGRTMCMRLCKNCDIIQGQCEWNCMTKKRLLPACSSGTQEQCCSWRDSEVDGEPDLVPSEDVPRSRPRAGRAASPRPSSPRSGSPPSSGAFSCSSTSWSSWQTFSAGSALAHLKKKR